MSKPFENVPTTEKRKVKLKVTFVVEREYPADWSDESILFHCNESSSCRNNLLRDRLRAEEEGRADCTCFDADDVEILP